MNALGAVTRKFRREPGPSLYTPRVYIKPKLKPQAPYTQSPEPQTQTGRLGP